MSVSPPRLAEPQRLTRRDWLLACGVALLAVLIRLPAAFKGFWIDEYYTLGAARMDVANLIAERMSVGHLPFYFLYAKLGLLFGNAEWQLRLTSLLPLAFTIICMTGLAGELKLKRYLPTLWVLALFNPYWVTIATEYRYMMLVVTSTLACAWATVVYSRQASFSSGVLMGLTSIVMVSVHPTSLFGVAALFTFLAWNSLHQRGRWSRHIFAHPLPLFASLISIAPILWLVRKSRMFNRPPQLPDWDHRFDDILEVSFGRTYLWSRWLDTLDVSFNQYILPTAMTLLLVLSFFVARREIRRRGLNVAWRLLLSLLFFFPLSYLAFSALIINIQGSARYWCILSIPTMLLIGLAWHAPMQANMRTVYRGLVVFVLGIQFISTMADRGDLQREAVQYVMDQHSDQDMVLVARGESYVEAFRYLGFTDWDRFDIIQTSHRNSESVAGQLHRFLDRQPRLLVVFYRPKTDVEDSLEHLEEHYSIAGWKLWTLNAQTQIAAIARGGEDQLDWLRNLPTPKRPFGASRGDEK